MFDHALMSEINRIPGYENKKAFAGAFVTLPDGKMAPRPLKCVRPGTNKKFSLDYILDAVGLKDGMTISFHHCLRNGDASPPHSATSSRGPIAQRLASTPNRRRSDSWAAEKSGGCCSET